MDVKSLDLEICKVKVKLKEWEFEFYAKHHRKPNKDDISEGSRDLQDAYRKYFKLKQRREKLVSGSKASQEQTKMLSNSGVWSSDLNKKQDVVPSKVATLRKASTMHSLSSKLRINAAEMTRKKSAEERAKSAASKPKAKSAASEPIPAFRSDNDCEESSDLHKDDDDLEFFSELPMNCKIEVSKDTSNVAKSKAINIISAGVFSFSADGGPSSAMDWYTPAKADVCNEMPTKSEVEMDDKLRVPLRQENQASGTKLSSAENFPGIDCLPQRIDLSKSAVKDVFSINDEDFGDKKLDVPTESRVDEERKSTSGVGTSYGGILAPKRRNRSANLRIVDNCKTNAAELPDEILDDEFPIAQSKRRRCSTAQSASNKAPPTENYVRINLKKKVYSRGKAKFNFRNYKLKCWQRLQQRKGAIRSKNDEGEPIHDFKTETKREKTVCSKDRRDRKTAAKPVETSAILSEEPNQSDYAYTSVEPFFSMTNNDVPQRVADTIYSNLKKFGHEEFRDGQLEAITRILAGLSTLVIQPTGSGKSLCYLLPALMYARRYACMTVVISPLVSLMEDQVSRVPPCLKAACHHRNMTDTQRDKVKTAIMSGKIDVLFLSPEGIVSRSGTSAFGCLPPGSPPIAFVCIDEVHCVSSWSHNFRPTYLRLCRIIREKLNVKCVLGLTATATTTTIENISEHLGLQESDSQSVVRGTILPSNLRLTVSRDEARDQAVLQLLQSEPYASCESIIIYCIRREQTDRLAVLIRTCLQQKDEEWTAEAYHAGLSAAQRRRVQNRFMSGFLRVIIATVAFGMGLNKPDVRAVIHYNMPKSVESYVQEIGRAGRDGKPSYCHLFLDSKGADRRELRRHIFANTVDRSTVSKLLRIIFRKYKCSKLQDAERRIAQDVDTSQPNLSPKCSGHEVAFPIDEAVEQLDVKEEGIETLLCYLELHPGTPIQLLHRIYGICKLFCYGGTSELKDLAEKVPAISLAVNLKDKNRKSKSESNELEFNIVEIANTLGVESHVLRKQLCNLQWSTYTVDGETKYKKSGVVVDFQQLSFHVRTTGHLDDEELDRFTDYLHNRILLQEKVESQQLQFFHSILSRVSFSHHWDCEPVKCESKSDDLKCVIQSYFKLGYQEVPEEELDEEPCGTDPERVISTIRHFLLIHGSDGNFTGRSIARIFHGIASPRYPAEVWGRTRQFWRSHLDFDFNWLCKLATEEILRTRR